MAVRPKELTNTKGQRVDFKKKKIKGRAWGKSIKRRKKKKSEKEKSETCARTQRNDVLEVKGEESFKRYEEGMELSIKYATSTT